MADRRDKSLESFKPKPKGLKELEDLEDVFKALAHASRRQVLQVLRARGGSMTAGEIADRFSCSWPTTTRHLQVLTAANLIHVTREGREMRYVLDADHLQSVVGEWLAWFKS